MSTTSRRLGWSIESEPWMGGPQVDHLYRSKAAAARAAQRLANRYGHDYEVVAWSETGRVADASLLICPSEDES